MTKSKVIQRLRSLSLDDISLVFSRQIISGVLQLSIFILLSRSLGIERAGIIQLAITLTFFLTQLTNFGLPSSAVYFIASNRFNINKVWSATRNFYLCLVIIFSLVFFILLQIGWIETVFSGVSRLDLIIATLTYPFSLFSNFAGSLLQAKENFRSLNIALLAQPIVALAVLIILSYYEGLTTTMALLILLVSHGVSLVFFMVFLSRYCNIFVVDGFNRSYLRPALRYGFQAHLSNFITNLNYRFDLMIVNYFLGVGAAGVYSVAVKLAEQLWIFSEAVVIVIFPRLTRFEAKGEENSLLEWMVFMVLMLCLITSLFVGACSYFLINFIFGSEFAGASNILRILLVGAVLMSVARVLAHDVAARGRVSLNLLAAFIALIFGVVGNFLLIPDFGLVGAAFATSLSYFVMFIGQFYFQKRLFRKEILPFFNPGSRL